MKIQLRSPTNEKFSSFLLLVSINRLCAQLLPWSATSFKQQSSRGCWLKQWIFSWNWSKLYRLRHSTWRIFLLDGVSCNTLGPVINKTGTEFKNQAPRPKKSNIVSKCSYMACVTRPEKYKEKILNCDGILTRALQEHYHRPFWSFWADFRSSHITLALF